MILAIEGASAAGKTTWCCSHAADRYVPEAPADIAAPGLLAPAAEVARFWVNYNVERWQTVLALERERGVAVCDGDPLKLYYSWALWKCGVLTSELFDVESALYEEVIEQRRIGFVDYVLWLEVPADELRKRASADSTRRRRRHEMHLGLLPWMKRWFATRERLLPGSVHQIDGDFTFEMLQPREPSHRYDAGILPQLAAACKLATYRHD